MTGIHFKKHVDFKAGTITILQDKTRNYDKPVFIEIEMGTELRAAMLAAKKSDVLCPYAIHYRPKKITAQMRQGKVHQFAVTNDFLTKQFKKCRDLSGAYDHIELLQRPSFHDLRALGAWLYKEAGHSQDYIQALTGHASAKMLVHYQDGHDEIKPVKVSAGLRFSK